jgi:hypothetical protein
MSNKAFRLHNRVANYKGGYMHADKKKIHEVTSNRFDQDFFGIQETYSRVASDFAGQFATVMGREDRERRDMAIDAANPKEKIPEDMVSALLIDTVPAFAWTHAPEFNLPEDYMANDQVSLVQQSFINAQKQEEMFTNPENQRDNQGLNTDKTGKGNTTLTQDQFYNMDGSAAGLISNHLGGEARDESYRENSAESITAF